LLLSTLSRSLRGHADPDAKRQAPAVIRELQPAASSGPTNPLEWAVLHRKLEGRAFSLDRHRPLRAIYADPHQHIAIIKPAQRGVSEYAINVTGFALDRGASGLDRRRQGRPERGVYLPQKGGVGRLLEGAAVGAWPARART
jgi:hypothetical protein